LSSEYGLHFRAYGDPVDSACDALKRTKAMLEKELGSDLKVEAIERWSKTSRGYEEVKCFVRKCPQKDISRAITEQAWERLLILTVRKLPNICPGCSVEEAKRRLPTRVLDDIIQHLKNT
jgi:hypothetical protein